MKLNVDGGVEKSEMEGAMGATCRDDKGIFLGASAAVYAGITDPVAFEDCACREALKLANDLHIKRFMVASDCLTAINEKRQ
jgi:hypothetical protein